MQVKDLIYILSKLKPESEIHYHVEDDEVNSEWNLDTPESLLWIIEHEKDSNRVYINVSDVAYEQRTRVEAEFDVHMKKVSAEILQDYSPEEPK
jgi:hypothetical protein